MPRLNVPKDKISFALFGNKDGTISIARPNIGNYIILIKPMIRPRGTHKNTPNI